MQILHKKIKEILRSNNSRIDSKQTNKAFFYFMVNKKAAKGNLQLKFLLNL